MLKQKNFSLLLEKDANEALRQTFLAEHVLLLLIESKNFSKKLFCSEKNGLNKKFFFRSFLAEMFCLITPPPFFTKNSRGGKTQKTCIKKGWVNNPPPFLGRVGLFDRGCFISRDKVLHYKNLFGV